MIPRRSFLSTAARASALAALGPLDFLDSLPRVSAEEAAAPKGGVRFHPEIEPLVRLLEDTPRERVLEEVGTRVKAGLPYQKVLAALLLAGVRGIQPRPVGFKFHAVLVVNSAHLASLASPDTERWLPIFWAIDQYKASQSADEREGNWTMSAIDEAAVPKGRHANEAFIRAMDQWDEAAADVAVVGLARSASADELFEIFCRYGARDFRDIGHKAIYVANSFRCLDVIGWQHAEPVLRSLAYALLDRSGARENPADADLPADRPFRENLPKIADIRPDWLEGTVDDAATVEFLNSARMGSAADLSDLTRKLLNRGVAPRSIFNGIFAGAGEMLMQAPGIVSLHAMTFSNAVHYSWHRTRNDDTRRLLLLQNASFLPLYRGDRKDSGIHIDSLEPSEGQEQGEQGVAGIFEEISRDRLAASRRILAHLSGKDNAADFAQAARRMIFMKGTNAHDYKFSSAVLEDYQQLAPPWRDRLLAASAFYFRGAGDQDNGLVQRARAALT